MSAYKDAELALSIRSGHAIPIKADVRQISSVLKFAGGAFGKARSTTYSLRGCAHLFGSPYMLGLLRSRSIQAPDSRPCAARMCLGGTGTSD